MINQLAQHSINKQQLHLHYIQFNSMKNSLQLELQIRIRKANKYLISREYKKAIQEYSSTLQNYLQNRRYNSSVSQHFQSLLYSLRANANSLNLQFEAAEQDFQKSLTLNPYNSITLSKRARHFIKLKKLEEAVQDIDTALLYDPDNISLVALLNTILEESRQSSNKSSQQHIASLVQSVKKHLQVKQKESQRNITSSQSQQDEEQFLKFSKLKKIDRASIKVNTLKLSKRQSIVQFKEDQILEYEQNPPQQQKTTTELLQIDKINQILKDQEVELKKLEQQEEKQKQKDQQLIIVKIHEKSRKSILRKDSVFKDQNSTRFLSFTSPGNKKVDSSISNILRSNTSQQNKSISNFSRLSVKNIDGKFISHQPQKIKFQHSFSSFGLIDNKKKEDNQNIEDQNYKYALTLTQPKLQKRKSCFRVSKRFSIDQTDELCKTMPTRKTSNFLNIKSIDGEYHKKDKDDQQQGPIEIKISSDSDDQNQHDIFGHKKEKQLISLISSVNGKASKNQFAKNNQNQKDQKGPLQLNKKKSILKKDSFLDSPFQGWKSQKKKSVLFKTG